MLKYFLPVLVMLFICSGLAQADFYQWEDNDGNVHITDYPPPSKSAKNIKVHETESSSDLSAPAAPEKAPSQRRAIQPQNDAKPGQDNEVILYTTSWCPWCRKAKEFFASRNIRFTEYDIEKNRDAAERRKTFPGSGVPLAIVNGHVISGYSPPEYEAALK